MSIQFDSMNDAHETKLFLFIKTIKEDIIYCFFSFSGPKGVWTAEMKKEPLPKSTAFLEAIPTFSHMALKHLVDCGRVKFIISQNIDGLHLRSGLDPSRLAELHGNFFLEECPSCRSCLLRKTPVGSIGQKVTGNRCIGNRLSGKVCR